MSDRACGPAWAVARTSQMRRLGNHATTLGVNGSDERVKLLKPLRRTLRRGHPWVYRDATARINVRPGTVVTIVDEHDRFVARGWAEEGPIAIRVLTLRDEPLDAELLRRRIEAAADLRDRIVPPRTTAYRLLHGEGDRLPGIVCDVYAEFATLQLDGTATKFWRDAIVSVLVPVLQRRGVAGLMVRSGRRAERVVEHAWGAPPLQPVEVLEHGMRLEVDLLSGQKTGMFLDHRTSRRRVWELARGARVLDLYAYIGGFSAAAGLGGAVSVTTVDVAPAAIEHARRNWARNALPADAHQAVAADVPTFLQEARDGARRFDLVIADPPSFAPNQQAKPAALRSYLKLHTACMELLAPGGFYLAASCSSHIDPRDFEETLIEASDHARRNLQVLDRWGAPPDHPRLLGVPEGDYLKVVLTKAVD